MGIRKTISDKEKIINLIESLDSFYYQIMDNNDIIIGFKNLKYSQSYIMTYNSSLKRISPNTKFRKMYDILNKQQQDEIIACIENKFNIKIELIKSYFFS